MTERLATSALAEAVQEAVLGTPGVAFLRPGIADLLRAANPLTKGTATSPRSSAVRITRDKGTAGRHAEVHVVLSRGHRAVDVTREIRAAVTRTLERLTGEQPSRVSVTVTGRV
ncbi:Asp23/Gls24 family envelope stress response protein [Streptomyces atriruber]|uniref:Asp23/Gls24 family envelope stress response protein n=1 Tax=Streptomyces atriruber TaxID=545121 RepID=UPI0006E195AF|nr:Asp23/Gls24 family envelope stress response protein [Streptomyces atriruber]